mmetsp:Transcript_11005/g.18461  ORF Transcript_11005/g.18461 Transcript_11005/m.18461 type:complete len:797 (-) Transcript_11005:203-2593(-)
MRGLSIAVHLSLGLLQLCPVFVLSFSNFRWISYNIRSTNANREYTTARKLTRSERELQEIQYKQYDGEKIDKYYRKRPWVVWERLVDIASPVLGWWMLQKFDNITASYRTEEDNRQRLLDRAEDLRDAIVQGKSVTFIKSGQALALRPDIVKSPEYVAQLTTLQDEVGTFDNNQAMEIIRTELGSPAQELFHFDPPVPIASASIGQVYRATLRSTNTSVAVKVQRPDAIEKVGIDMFILRRIAAFIKKRRKLNTNLVGVVDEFGNQLFQELNYVQEGQNCVRFKELYGQIPDIYVPGVYFEHTSRRVLTMEFVEGVKGPWEEGGERMLTVGLQCSVLQLLGTGFFHSDPHRGNLLRTPDNKLAYLDFGMMAEVPSSKRYAMIGTVLGLVNKDISMVINGMNELEFFPPDTDTEIVVSSLSAALANSTDTGSSSSLNFTKLNTNLNRISDKLPFRLPPYYSLIIRSLTILEGLALYVDPSFRLVKGAYPFVARQILAEPSAEMNQLLKDVLLTKENQINWKQLEQFFSISSKAEAAMGGDFEALRSAQNKADVARIYTGTSRRRDTGEIEEEEEDEPVSLELASQILDYLLSDRGAYLREPLIADVVDILDSLGLTAQSTLSLLSNRLIPAPTEKPNREKVVQFLNLVTNLSAGSPNSRQDRSGSSSDGSRGINANIVGQLASNLSSFLQSVGRRRVGTSRTSLQQQQQTQILLGKVSVLVGQVVGRLVERRTRQTVKSIFSPGNIEATLPFVSQLLEVVPRFPIPIRPPSSSSTTTTTTSTDSIDSSSAVPRRRRT